MIWRKNNMKKFAIILSIITIIVFIIRVFVSFSSSDNLAWSEQVPAWETETPAEICSLDHSGNWVTRQYSWGGWYMAIYIPGLGCYMNDPGPRYINLGVVKISIHIWWKGWHEIHTIYPNLGGY